MPASTSAPPAPASHTPASTVSVASPAAEGSMARPRLLDATERTCVRRDRDGAEYRGRFVSDWDIGSVPNGGYSLGTVVHCAKDFVDGLVAEDEASGASSSATSNYCLLHAGAAYLVAVTSTKDWHVEVRLEKKGRSYIYLDCTLKQAPRKTGKAALVACQRVNMIFANFAATHSAEAPGMHVFAVPDASPYSFKTPLQSAPMPRSECKPWFPTSPWPVQGHDEAAIAAQQERGRLFWGGYMYMPETDEAQVTNPANIARYNHALITMLCDQAGTPKHMLPPNAEPGNVKQFWYPTLFLTVEIKRPLPTDFVLTRVGATACTNEVRPGQWGYDIEIWSHPDDAQRLGLPAGVTSVRLALSRQVASMMSFAINQGFVKKGGDGEAGKGAKL